MNDVPAPQLVADSTDDFGIRHIVFGLGDGTLHTLNIAMPPPGTAGPTEFLALPVIPGTAAAPGFMLWVPFEGAPQYRWLGYASLEDALDRWVGDLAERQPELAEVMSQLLTVLAGDKDDDGHPA